MTQEVKGAAVKLRALTKKYGNVLAVKDVNLDITPGEFITLLGPSGSGKTTTLLMIAGFEIPTGGEILINDKPVMFKPPYKRDIGMVFQHYSLFPHMTVERNIGFPLRMRNKDKKEIKRRTNEVLSLVKLDGYNNRFPKQLSGGQQQRIALARALVFNPSVLLMDEPLGALDKKLREHMQLEITQITRSLSITVIYVTHDQDEALTMSDRIAVMNNGYIEQLGTPGEIYDEPTNYFVADFIGESNFMEGVLEKVEDGVGRFRNNCGVEFKAIVSEQKRGGGKGYLAIRPEKISFVRPEESFPNQFDVVIRDKLYCGDITKFRAVLVEDGSEVFIKQQNKRTTMQINQGDKRLIGWRVRDSRILFDQGHQ